MATIAIQLSVEHAQSCAGCLTLTGPHHFIESIHVDYLFSLKKVLILT